jgi:hypothetical protein
MLTGDRRQPQSGEMRHLLLLSALLLASTRAGAHPMDPGHLALDGDGGGTYRVTWTVPLATVGTIRPELPMDCEGGAARERQQVADRASETWEATCGAPLAGRVVSVRGLDLAETTAIAELTEGGGPTLRAVFTASTPSWEIPAEQGAAGVFRQFVALGWHHILEGIDHLLFVLGLVLLCGTPSRVLAAVTAFTIGHSVTLGLVAVGHITLPGAWVELVIAASIALVARELLVPRQTWTRRMPAVVAGGFGLLHGLGFAGALAEVGIPPESALTALFAFNVGIELGQIAFVAGVSALALLTRPAWRPRLVELTAYGIGGFAAALALERAAALWGFG